MLCFKLLCLIKISKTLEAMIYVGWFYKKGVLHVYDNCRCGRVGALSSIATQSEISCEIGLLSRWRNLRARNVEKA